VQQHSLAREYAHVPLPFPSAFIGALTPALLAGFFPRFPFYFEIEPFGSSASFDFGWISKASALSDFVVQPTCLRLPVMSALAPHRG
jgi:hypothetical protein